MQQYQIKEIKQKFKTINPLEDLNELLHISQNLNLAIDKYYADFGAQCKQKVKYWNNRMTEFLIQRKVSNDTLEN